MCNDDGTQPANTQRGTIGLPVNADDIEVFFGPESIFPLEVRPEPAAFGVEVFGSGTTTVCSDNIAAIVLDRDLPTNGLALRVNRPVVPGEEVTLIGFEHLRPPRRRRSHVPVLAVGPDDLSGGLGDTLPRAFLIGDGPCVGDLGGPAVSDESGAVVGIYSFTTTGSDWDCTPGLRAIYTKVAPFVPLLEQALESAGRKLRGEEEPSGEAPPEAGGCSFGRSGSRAASSLAWASLVLALILARWQVRVRRSQGP
jgi:hypothetical protein